MGTNVESYFGRGMKLNGIDQSITIPINDNVSIYKMVDGVSIYEPQSVITDYIINQSGIHSNYILYKGEFSQIQVDYLNKYPETFLYREDDILKSKILNQSEIDSVKVFMPNVDTDGYARNLANYNESSELVGNVDFNDTGWWTNNGGTITGGQLVLDVTNDYYGIQKYNYFPTDVPMLVEIKIDQCDNFNQAGMRLGGAFTPFSSLGITKLGISKVIITFTGLDVRLYGKVGYVTKIDSISIKQLTGAHKISNYTLSVRDAINLQTGLQTSKWNRDLLGVPNGLSSGLELDGVGYLDTKWIAPLNTDSETIEIIVSKPSIIQDGDNKYFSLTGQNMSSTVEISEGTNEMYIRHRGLDTHFTLVENFYHIILTVDTNNVYLYVNGLLDTTSVKVSYSATQSLLLGIYNVNTPEAINSSKFNLFKKYSKTMAPQEVKYLYEHRMLDGLNGELESEIDTFELFNKVIKPNKYYKWVTSNDGFIIASNDGYILTTERN